MLHTLSGVECLWRREAWQQEGAWSGDAVDAFAYCAVTLFALLTALNTLVTFSQGLPSVALGNLAAADSDAVGVGSVEQTELTDLILLPELDSIPSLIRLHVKWRAGKHTVQEHQLVLVTRQTHLTVGVK